ncbi:acetate kinase [Algicola sagamiensis]|uniref:acetate kinase n=1 Tax=Algicola sagamiensis TaxID=163869 RepID=UPI0004783BF2|nr:acetate kinase [Algicola sagamiensis]
MTSSCVLVLNCGSSSLKFAVIDTQSGNTSLSGLAEKLGEQDPQISWKVQQDKQKKQLPAHAAHHEALEALVNIIKQMGFDTSLIAVGHRVVHGGENFTQSVIINEQVKETIRKKSQLAPLHNPANLLGIDAAEAAFPELPQVAVFDTAFHQSLPQKAFLYALPYSLYQNHGVRKYGFHGTSHYFVANEAAKALGKPVEQCNLITAHLGNGCSIAAIKNGESVDTSMGLTPLEGLVMGTRSGDIDPGIFNFLNEQLGYAPEEINAILNKSSGLKGISEISNDCRNLEEAAEQVNERAQLALEIFAYRIAKYIASYTVPLGRLDAIIFTGGIGENSSYIRELVIRQLAIFQLELDEERNLAARFGQSGNILKDSAIQALVIPTNEEWVIANDAAMLTSSQEEQ